MLIHISTGFFIWLMSLLGGGLALSLRHTPHKSILHLAESFAGGIFLGAALFHMLPDAEEALQQAYASHLTHYPLANLIAAGSFVLLLFLEQALSQTRVRHRQSNWLPVLFTGLISIHALSEGMALGISKDTASIMVIFMAIAVHKSSEAFAVGMQLQQSALSLLKIMSLFLLFSLMTPLGIFLGVTAETLVTGRAGLVLLGAANAFAAGTFLYLATLHKLHHHHTHEGSAMSEFFALLLGLILMALAANWL